MRCPRARITGVLLEDCCILHPLTDFPIVHHLGITYALHKRSTILYFYKKMVITLRRPLFVVFRVMLHQLLLNKIAAILIFSSQGAN